MPNNSYLSLGFGSNMSRVDMIAWHGYGETAAAVDYWSTSKKTPLPDPEDQQNLETTYEMSEDGKRVNFVTTRKLDTGDSELDYLVPLDKEIDMVWAFTISSGEWIEHFKYGLFKVTFDETLGNNPLAPSDFIGRVEKTGTGIEELACFEKSWDEFKLDSCYDQAT